MTKQAADKILAARTALLWAHPFFGTLAVQLQTVDATDDPEIDTMATDGRHLFFHAPFVDKLTKQELMFVLAHEVLHNAFEHHVRRQSRDPLLWNVAADYVINGELTECKVGTMPKDGLLNPAFTGLSAEEVYRLLEQEGGGKGKGQGKGGGGSKLDPGGCGRVIDACPQFDQAAIAEARAEMQTKVRQAAALARGIQAGSMPAGIKRLIDQLTKPVIDWRALLRRFIDESTVRDTSWARPNRRFLPAGLILPGSISDGVSHMVIAVDTSASIDNEILNAFASEIDAAMNEGMIDKITIVYADAQVARHDVFERGDELEIKPAGGGGTAFADTFRWVAEHAKDARLLCYFTDLYVSDFGLEPDMPVLWAVHGDSRMFPDLAAKTPFGEAISLAAA